MKTYVIGDIHGCYSELETLFNKIKFNKHYDKAIFVGDLIGRGPRSKEVINFVMNLGDSAITLLGNHEIKFLSQVYHYLEVTPDMVELFENSQLLYSYKKWLSKKNFLHIDKKHPVFISHAGIPPNWESIEVIKKYNNLIISYREKFGMQSLIKLVRYDKDIFWKKKMTLEEIIQFSIFGLTKMKYCYNKYSFNATFQKHPNSAPKNITPWFSFINSSKYKIIFGHWASLGTYKYKNIICCDSGCVWGGSLTAIEMHNNYSFINNTM
mgnify:CR=1 FL=1